MGRLIYMAIASLDGYVEDTEGRFEWAAPSEEVHAFVNDLMRNVGTYLYGRRMYETMQGWETDPSLASGSRVNAEFATIWQGAEKVVFSSTLDTPSTTQTRIDPVFDPEVVRAAKEAADDDLGIGGAQLAAEAFRAGLVDECHLLLIPTIVGGGKGALPRGVRRDLELLDHRRFANGTVYLRYHVSS